MASTPGAGDGRRKAAAARRRAREAQIIAATRELFDAKGVREVQIDEIAGAVGINRAIVYRHFTGKEEIFALTLVGYLDELHEALVEAGASASDPTDRLAATIHAFVDFGLAHPAFVECAQALMLRPGDELLDEVSERALFLLGRAMTSCMGVLSDVLVDGVASGRFTATQDPTLLANMLYASGLGALQLARLGILVGEAAPGVPTRGPISPDQVREFVVSSALAMLAQPASA
ncbi:MAG: TetR/AcrR family transcriptional regulator [Nocardioidaceae bacterium]|nr:TetR/AcrR family transcriptional regulator [Nocardioidaceae bacterium]MCL2611798.1 TetR/AcrR family transcriptional regulator [Nocardioidaceae bacterium]